MFDRVIFAQLGGIVDGEPPGSSVPAWWTGEAEPPKEGGRGEVTPRETAVGPNMLGTGEPKGRGGGVSAPLTEDARLGKPKWDALFGVTPMETS